MNNHPRRHPARRPLAASVVLGLATAGLGAGMAPASSAAPATGTAAAAYVASTSATAVLVYRNEQSNETRSFNFHNLYVGQTSIQAQNVPGGVRTSEARVLGWSSDELTIRNNVQSPQETLRGPEAITSSPNPRGSSSLVGGAYDAHGFRFSGIVGSTEARAADSGATCVPVGDALGVTDSTTRTLDYLPRTRFSGHVLDMFSPAPGGAEVGVRATSSMYRLPGGRRGVRSEAAGSATSFRLLNDQVRVDVLAGPGVVVMNDGGSPTVVATGADISVTGPDAVVHRFEGGAGTLTYTDVNDPSLSMTVTLNEGAGAATVFSPVANSVNASGAVTAVGVRYRDSSQAAADAGSVRVGQVAAGAQVPTGGVDCGPEPDADADGLADVEETDTYLTDPDDADSDDDGLLDGEEVRLGTSPLRKDTDGGTVEDGVEHARGTDPLDPADDVPPIVPVAEPPAPTASQTPPAAEESPAPVATPAASTPAPGRDSDGDGLTDAEEQALGTDPHSARSDGDRLSDAQEVRYGTDPLRRDTDRDGLGDYREVMTSRTDPLRKDTDRDGLRDRAELTGSRNTRYDEERTDPRRKDSDRDGVADLREIRAGSNPADRRSTPRHP